MLLVGDNSPHDEEVMDMNGRMDPEKTDFVKVRQYQSCQVSIVLHSWSISVNNQHSGLRLNQFSSVEAKFHFLVWHFFQRSW